MILYSLFHICNSSVHAQSRIFILLLDVIGFNRMTRFDNRISTLPSSTGISGITASVALMIVCQSLLLQQQWSVSGQLVKFSGHSAVCEPQLKLPAAVLCDAICSRRRHTQ